MNWEGPFWVPDARTIAVLFVQAMIDPNITSEQKDRLVAQWNEAQRRKKEKQYGVR